MVLGVLSGKIVQRVLPRFLDRYYMVFLGIQLLKEVMMYFVFTFVDIILYDIPRICAFHCVI